MRCLGYTKIKGYNSDPQKAHKVLGTTNMVGVIKNQCEGYNKDVYRFQWSHSHSPQVLHIEFVDK